jgi:iron complex outermembrane receptor protein
VRPPSLEELYSDGPHLADFSFDIGNPALGAEVAWGWDLFLRGSTARLDLEFTGFLNHVADYIAYTQTGETLRVLRDGEAPRMTPVYEATAEDARFMGLEGRIQAELLPNWVWDAQMSYTRAHRRRDGDPLAFIPPLGGRTEIRFSPGAGYLALGARASAPQERVPRGISVGDIMELPQNPTPGFGLIHLGGGWRVSHGQWTHGLHVQVENLADRIWRDHLSRIKDVAPQPGRSMQFTWRIYF